MQWFCTTNRTTTTNSAPASSISLVVHVTITWVRDRTRSPCPSQLCCLLYARLRLRPRSLEHVKGECGRIVEGRHELATDMKCLMHMRARWRRLASDLGKLPASQLRLLLLFHQKKRSLLLARHRSENFRNRRIPSSTKLPSTFPKKCRERVGTGQVDLTQKIIKVSNLPVSSYVCTWM